MFGRNFIDRVYKILKIGSIYEIDHNQTTMAANEFMEFFNEAFHSYDEEEMSFLVRDELAIVNGQSVRLRRKNQERLNELRALFAKADIKGLLLKRGMPLSDFLDFLTELKIATRTVWRDDGFMSICLPSRSNTGNLLDTCWRKSSTSTKRCTCFTSTFAVLVKTKNMHDQVREKRSGDIPTGVIRRIMQSVSQLLADEDFIILGLLPLRIVPP